MDADVPQCPAMGRQKVDTNSDHAPMNENSQTVDVRLFLLLQMTS